MSHDFIGIHWNWAKAHIPMDPFFFMIFSTSSWKHLLARSVVSCQPALIAESHISCSVTVGVMELAKIIAALSKEFIAVKKWGNEGVAVDKGSSDMSDSFSSFHMALFVPCCTFFTAKAELIRCSCQSFWLLDFSALRVCLIMCLSGFDSNLHYPTCPT